MVISHLPESRAEPNVAFLRYGHIKFLFLYIWFSRLLVDKYSDIDLSSVTSNYTVADLVILTPSENERTGRYIDIAVRRAKQFSNDMHHFCLLVP